MDAIEIFPLTRSAVRKLLDAREESAAFRGHERRKRSRSTFPGTAELWLTGADGKQYHELATCSDLSENGAGLVCEQGLPVGDTLEIAIHQPEASYHGRATVRHCTQRDDRFFVGMQFTE